MTAETTQGPTWITDENGNRCSVEYWGTEEKAREALASLKNCENCTNCSRCSYCSDCSDCSDCSRCSYCSRCSDCSYCSRVQENKEQNGDTSEPQKNPWAFPEIPVIENIHQKVYEAVQAPDALDMSTWHTCDTTHCRAGWVTTLAGEAGKKLEMETSCLFAAMQIYKASGSPINPCRFYDSNEDALADMKKLAEEEAARAAT